MLSHPSQRRHAVRTSIVVCAAGALVWTWAASALSDEPTPAPSGEPVATAAPTSSPTQPPAATPEPSPSSAPDDATSAPAAVPGAGAADAAPAPAPGGPAVDVVVAYLGWVPGSAAVEVTAYVPVIDTTGTCTLTLTSGGTTASSGAQEALPDATTTSCGTLSVPRSALAAGTWEVTVGYASSTAQGVSAPQTVQVP